MPLGRVADLGAANFAKSKIFAYNNTVGITSDKSQWAMKFIET